MTWRVVQLSNSGPIPYANRAVLYSMKLCRENAERWLDSYRLCDKVTVCDLHSSIKKPRHV